jgi:hypothetical protein
MTSTIIYPPELSSLIESTIEANNDRCFEPTYLYIKQHTLTGKLYFGKTTLNHDDMLKYIGSGSYWQHHIEIHGKDINTIWFCLFTNLENLVEFALSFCYLHDIGFNNQDTWANLRPENGVDGTTKGHKFTNEQNSKKGRKGINNAKYGKPLSQDIKKKISITNKIKRIEPVNCRKPKSEEHKEKLRLIASNPSEETRAKKRASALARAETTPEARANMCKAQQNRKPISDATRAKMKASAKLRCEHQKLIKSSL